MLEEKSTGRKTQRITRSRSGDSESPTPYDDETPSPSPPPITVDEDDGEPGMSEMVIWHAVGLWPLFFEVVPWAG